MSKKKARRKAIVGARPEGRRKLMLLVALILAMATGGLIIAQRTHIWASFSPGTTSPDPAPQSTPTLTKEYVYAGGRLIATEEPAGAPAAPTGLTATPGNQQVSLTWNASAGAASYTVKRSTINGGPYSPIATNVTVTNFTNTGLTNGTTYHYVVSASNAAGESSNSLQASATPSSGGGGPTAPSCLASVSISASRVDLSWLDNSTNESGFKVERKTGAAGTYSQIATPGVNATAFSDTTVTAGNTYFYRVRASGIPDSDYSNEASASAASAGASTPGSLAATAVSSSQINLTWTDNSANENGFKLERKTGAAGTYSIITVLCENATSYIDTGLTAGAKYFYRVRAFNSAGDSPFSPESNATTSLQLPSALAASALSSSQINLSWSDNSSNELDFRIERKIGAGGSFAEIASASANATSFSDTGLSASTHYFYRVRARTSDAFSPYSNEANATTSGGGSSPPSAPTSLTAVAASAHQIDLNWTDNSNNESGFRIEIDAGNGFMLLTTVGANVTSYSDKTVNPSAFYCYRVKAFNSAGDSAYSNSQCLWAPDLEAQLQSSVEGYNERLVSGSPGHQEKSNNVAVIRRGFTVVSLMLLFTLMWRRAGSSRNVRRKRPREFAGKRTAGGER